MYAPVITPTKPRRRWLQFNLRTALIALTVVGLVLAAGRQVWRQVHWETVLAEQLRARGAKVAMRGVRPKGRFAFMLPDSIPSITWVVLRGRNFTDDDLALLATLEHLESLDIHDTSISRWAAERFRPGCSVVPETMSPSSNILDALNSRTSEEDFHTAIDYVLRWKLACAACDKDEQAERMAYEECAARFVVRAPQSVPAYGTTDSTKHAFLDLRRAECGQSASEIADGVEFVHSHVETLAHWLHKMQMPLANSGETEHFIAGTQCVREVRGHLAHRRGDRSAELQASDEAIGEFEFALCALLTEPTALDRLYQRTPRNATNRLAIVLEWEKLLRCRVAQTPMPRAEAEKTLRRVLLARADIISRWNVDAHRWWLLDLADRLIFAMHSSHPGLPDQEEQLEQPYADILRDRACTAAMLSTVNDLRVIAYYLQRQEQTGEAVPRLKQFEIHRLLAAPPKATRSFKDCQQPTTDDWCKEYAEELREQPELRRDRDAP